MADRDVRGWATRLQQWSAAATAPASLASARTGLGTLLLVAPQALPRLLGVDAAATARTTWVVQMLAVREVAIGAGVLSADRTGGARPWLVAGGACDLVDALVVGAAVRRGAVSRPWGSAVALSAVAVGAAGLLGGRR